MNDYGQSTFLGEHLNQILTITNGIANKAASGEFIYRGEPKYFEKISSSLYRLYQGNSSETFSISAIQQEILEEAKRYTSETDEIEILSELQHYGGKTNLIDFTADYLTALFFACDGYPREDGRIILIKKTGAAEKYIKEPRKLTNRAIVQKSVFVFPPEGFVDADDIVRIPREIKQPMLEYLRRSHNISVETIYNDLHGFIRQQNLHAMAYQQLYLGMTYHREENADFEHAIDHYTEAIALNPQLAAAYCGRGGAYSSLGEYHKAIQDFNHAIEADESHSCAYTNRGRAYSDLGDYEQAIVNFHRAIELNSNFENQTTAASHYYRGLSYMNIGEYDQAMQDLDRVIDQQLPPGAWNAYYGRGSVHLCKRDYDRAIDDYGRAMELAPENPDIYSIYGVVQVYMRNYRQAIDNFTKAIELDHSHAPSYHNRGVTSLFVSEWERARVDLATAKEMGMDVATIFRNDFRSVSDFERDYGVTIPRDIAEML